ncbi:MAG: hypothetical protein P0S94_05555 [Simkaniaceae bacterium]|nr:hypothetical protein [Simkaniaceae bacterium]
MGVNPTKSEQLIQGLIDLEGKVYEDDNKRQITDVAQKSIKQAGDVNQLLKTKKLNIKEMHRVYSQSIQSCKTLDKLVGLIGDLKSARSTLSLFVDIHSSDTDEDDFVDLGEAPPKIKEGGQVYNLAVELDRLIEIIDGKINRSLKQPIEQAQQIFGENLSDVNKSMRTLVDNNHQKGLVNSLLEEGVQGDFEEMKIVQRFADDIVNPRTPYTSLQINTNEYSTDHVVDAKKLIHGMHASTSAIKNEKIRKQAFHFVQNAVTQTILSDLTTLTTMALSTNDALSDAFFHFQPVLASPIQRSAKVNIAIDTSGKITVDVHCDLMIEGRISGGTTTLPMELFHSKGEMRFVVEPENDGYVMHDYSLAMRM